MKIDIRISSEMAYCIQLWNCPVLFLPYKKDQRSESALPGLEFAHTQIVVKLSFYIWFYWPSYKFALESDDKKGENK